MTAEDKQDQQAQQIQPVDQPDAVELSDEQVQAFSGGATAIEYGLIAALIGTALIPAVKGLGSSLGTTFTDVSNEMK